MWDFGEYDLGFTLIFFGCLGAMSDIRNWNSAKVFSHKQIKAATNNFKELLGRGSFGSVYLGKLLNGKMVAVKVRFDKSQLGADSFVNEVSYYDSFSISREIIMIFLSP